MGASMRSRALAPAHVRLRDRAAGQQRVAAHLRGLPEIDVADLHHRVTKRTPSDTRRLVALDCPA